MSENSSMQCRICLAHGAELYLFDSDESKEILSKLFQCINEQIEDKVGYPRHICTSCNKILDIAYSFVQTYKESNKVLKALKTTVKSEHFESENDDFEFEDNVEGKQEQEEVKQEIVAENDDFEFEDNVEVKQEQEEVKQEIVAKKEPKIEFDNAQQFLELIKPFELKVEKEPNTEIKVKPQSTIKKEIRKSKTNLSRKALKVRKTKIVVDKALEQRKTRNKSDTKQMKKSNSIDIEFDNTSGTKQEKQREDKILHKEKKEPRASILCEICGDVFKSPDHLSTHRYKIHFQSTVQCPVCKKIASSPYALKRHYRRIHSTENRNFVCSACGKAYVYSSDLDSHYLHAHAKHLVKKKRYACKECDRTFASAKILVVHGRSAHTGERPAVCSVCDARFFDDNYLKEHMRLHTGETPFKCPICHRGYAQRGNMKSHIRHRHSVSELDELTLKILKPDILKILKS